MITKVRQVTPGRQFGRMPPVNRPDPIVRNEGAKSLILSVLEERIAEAIQNGKHQRITLDIRLTPQGIEEYDLMTGDSIRVA